MIYSLLYAKLPPKLKRSVNMARLENCSYDEIVAHLEKELELNALEESDDLPMATMTSSSSKPKTPSPICKRPTSPAITAGERAIWSKTVNCEKLKKNKEKDAQQGKPTQKKTYLGRVPAIILNLRAPDLSTNRIKILILKLQNPTITQHRRLLSLPPRKSTKKITSPRLQYNQLASVRQ